MPMEPEIGDSFFVAQKDRTFHHRLAGSRHTVEMERSVNFTHYLHGHDLKFALIHMEYFTSFRCEK
jgi:hypothetical protein